MMHKENARKTKVKKYYINARKTKIIDYIRLLEDKENYFKL